MGFSVKIHTIVKWLGCKNAYKMDGLGELVRGAGCASWLRHQGRVVHSRKTIPARNPKKTLILIEFLIYRERF